MRDIDKIIVHCTATPEGRHTTVEDVRRWHLDRGWSDIGYHFLIYLDGSLHEGRPIEKTGAHCKGHNKGSIGIAYVGGIDRVDFKPKDTRTEEQKEALVYILEYLIYNTQVLRYTVIMILLIKLALVLMQQKNTIT